MIRMLPESFRPALLSIFVVAAGSSAAQAPEKPRIYALVSAIGGEITVVRQRRDVGSNIEPYRRQAFAVPDSSVDSAVLRGLDRAVATEDPDSERIFMRLSSEQVKGVFGHQRGEVLSSRALAALETMPERKSWYRIILVAPRFMNVGYEGMGAKLHGIGIYVQPVGRSRVGMGVGESEIEMSSDPETISPDGEKSHSYKYVAPYFYAQIWVIDAQTMKVIETNDRYDFQRIYDPKSAALDVAAQMTPEVLANMVERFVEKASARALNDQQGQVIIHEPRIVNPSTPK